MFSNIYKSIFLVGNSLQSFLLLLIRLYWGYQFAITGFGKFLHFENITAYFQSLKIPFPSFSAGLTGSIELICGALLFIGLFSRAAVIPLMCVMLGAWFTSERDALISLFKNFEPTPFFNSTPFLFTYAVVIVFCFGPGKISLDYWVGKFYKSKEMP